MVLLELYIHSITVYYTLHSQVDFYMRFAKYGYMKSC